MDNIERIVDAFAPLADECLALVHDAGLPAIVRLEVLVANNEGRYAITS